MKTILSVHGLAFLLVCGLEAVAAYGADAEPTAEASTETAATVATTDQPAAPQPWEAQWGIQIAPVRVSAQGYMIDFRYKIVDPAKAAALGNRELRPYLIDQKTGARLVVPTMPKVGSLRQSGVAVAPGRTFATLFWNPGHVVQAGSKVTVVIGECRMEDLTVE